MRLFGSITALATPFNASGEIDLEAWLRLLALQLDGGTQAIVVAGSTGEAAALFDVEFDTLLRSAVEFVAGHAGDRHVPVLAGTGGSNTAKTIEYTRRAAALGADAALVVTPPYVRPTQPGLVAHYRAIADDGALPVVLYNVPGRTGGDLLPETVAELVSHPRIIGIKEARSEPERMAALLAFKSENFAVLSGDDPTACRAMLAGADGVISVGSNVLPGSFRRLSDLARAGKGAEALAWDAQLAAVYDFLGVESNPIPVKALLSRLGIGHGLRLPLLPLSSQHADAAAAIAAAVLELEHACRDSLAA
ncbi:4-hydroxy-tetrahydrodipicolinate synthase [Lysobacter koreensis]|uniref:4-hydroxy-tetrahydrodipicolinate synthase n=1 Tax=Lysobacter koreensis TaxID=266122 RepID=A0ABW2YJ95_9GAMM